METKVNTGAIFKNDKKTKETHPDYRGKVNVNGKEMEIVGLLTPNRHEDEGDDMWKVFNVVQEKFVRGGVEVTSPKGRVTKLRGLQNIMAVNTLNTKLWELADAMC